MSGEYLDAVGKLGAALRRITELEEALRSVVADIEDYERVNNLSPSPGKRDCWQSLTHAKMILGKP